MAIFNCYVSSPEGSSSIFSIFLCFFLHRNFWHRTQRTNCSSGPSSHGQGWLQELVHDVLRWPTRKLKHTGVNQKKPRIAVYVCILYYTDRDNNIYNTYTIIRIHMYVYIIYREGDTMRVEKNKTWDSLWQSNIPIRCNKFLLLIGFNL